MNQADRGDRRFFASVEAQESVMDALARLREALSDLEAAFDRYAERHPEDPDA